MDVLRLSYHENIHTNEKSFTEKNNYKAERVHECHTCGKTFGRSHDLKTHEITDMAQCLSLLTLRGFTCD